MPVALRSPADERRYDSMTFRRTAAGLDLPTLSLGLWHTAIEPYAVDGTGRQPSALVPCRCVDVRADQVDENDCSAARRFRNERLPDIGPRWVTASAPARFA